MLNKQQIKELLSSSDKKPENITHRTPRPTHLQIRQYVSCFEDGAMTTYTLDWYDAQSFNGKHLENYVCSFIESAKQCLNVFTEPMIQKPNAYYFTRCEKCLYTILTNRDIGKKLVCMSPEQQCSHYNHTQPLANDDFMKDVLEIVNEHYMLNFT